MKIQVKLLWPMAKRSHLQKPDFMGSTVRSKNVVPLGISFSFLATSKCRQPTNDSPSIFSIWSPTATRGTLSMMLPSLIRLMKAYPAPLSVMVNPKASSDLVTSTSFGCPFMWAKMKSSRPICPPSSRFMSTLCVFRVQNKIWTVAETSKWNVAENKSSVTGTVLTANRGSSKSVCECKKKVSNH